jgi:tetratricopeptide (TPR) repeat protein
MVVETGTQKTPERLALNFSAILLVLMILGAWSAGWFRADTLVTSKPDAGGHQALLDSATRIGAISDQSLDGCIKIGRKSSPDSMISSCTELIMDPATPLERLEQAYINRGVGYFGYGDFKRAIADYDKAIQLKADDTSAYINRGAAYGALRDFPRAIVDLDKAIGLKPGNAMALGNRCYTRAIAGTDLEYARNDCDEAIKLEPRNSKHYVSRGLVDLKQGLWEEALLDYEYALDIDDPYLKSDGSNSDYNLSALFGRGVARLRLGQVGEGQADIAQATEIDQNVAKAFERDGIVP